MTNITIQGFFVNYDKYNRARIMFLDDYDPESLNSFKWVLSPSDKMTTFTKSFMIQKSHIKNGKSPMTECGKCFNVKCDKKSLCYINNKVVPILDLKQHKVSMLVKVSPYNFKGTKGWSIKLIRADLTEY